MTIIPEQHAFMMDLARLLQRAEALGYLVTGGELWRTQEQEDRDVAAGLSETTHSNHLRRLAVDLNFFKPDGAGPFVQVAAPDLGNYWESLCPLNRWGGHYVTLKDPAHFERNSPNG